MSAPILPQSRKTAEKICKGEFIELSKLSPSRFGALEVLLRDQMASRDKPKEPKKISTIQQWMVCFNAYINVMAVQQPGRVGDLLAHSSTITKASLDYEGVPWLAYNSHFRRSAASSKLLDWSSADASLWTLYFTSTKLSVGGAGGLMVVSSLLKDQKQEGSNNLVNGSGLNRRCK